VWIDRHTNPRICVPQKYRTAILREYHDLPLGGHFGVDKTYFNIRQKYIWPNMDHFVQVYVTSCDACQKNKASHKAKLGTPQLSDPPEKPWEALSVDLCGPFPKTKNGNDYVIGFICNLTREAILIPCQKTLTARGAADLFLKHVLRRADLPKRSTLIEDPSLLQISGVPYGKPSRLRWLTQPPIILSPTPSSSDKTKPSLRPSGVL